MGYDCYVQGAKEMSYPPYDMENRDKALTEYFEWQNASHTYFRRNIWGMRPTRDALEAMGMGFWVEEMSMPEFPDSNEMSIDWERDFEDGDSDKPITEAGKRYSEALANHLRWHGPEIPGIPLHKFCSNDGWHVTREECTAAIQLYELAIRGGKPHPEAFGNDLIPFLKCGARHDGFEVH